MNSLINKYLQAMDFYISFLDEEFNETLSQDLEIPLTIITLVRVKK